MKHLSPKDIFVLFILVNLLGFPGNIGKEISSSVNTLVEYGAFLCEIYLVVRYSRKTVRLFNNKAVYLFWAIISVVSLAVTNYPSQQFITCIRLLVTIVFAQWMINHYSPKQIISLAYRAQILIVLSILAYIVIDPASAFRGPQNTSRALRGIFTAKNGCGAEMCFGMVITYLYYIYNAHLKKKTKKRILYFLAFEGVLLLLSKSTTSIILAVICLGYLYRYSKKRFNLASFFFTANLIFLILMAVFVEFLEPLLSAIGKDVTLTGRTGIWKQVEVVMTQTHTMTGFGFGMFWRDEKAYSLFHAGFDEFSWAANMKAGAHNAILEMWLNIGLIGIAAFMLMILVSVFNNHKKLNHEYWLLSSVYMIYFTIFGLMERSLGVYDYKTLFLFLVLGMVGAYQGKMKDMKRLQQLQRRYNRDDEKNSNMHPDLQEAGAAE